MPSRRLRVHAIQQLKNLWLLKILNAPKSLEFLDSPTQYRRHVHARAIDRFSACMPIP
jgi:hypothetical protein